MKTKNYYSNVRSFSKNLYPNHKTSFIKFLETNIDRSASKNRLKKLTRSISKAYVHSSSPKNIVKFPIVYPRYFKRSYKNIHTLNSRTLLPTTQRKTYKSQFSMDISREQDASSNCNCTLNESRSVEAVVKHDSKAYEKSSQNRRHVDSSQTKSERDGSFIIKRIAGVTRIPKTTENFIHNWSLSLTKNFEVASSAMSCIILNNMAHKTDSFWHLHCRKQDKIYIYDNIDKTDKLPAKGIKANGSKIQSSTTIIKKRPRDDEDFCTALNRYTKNNKIREDRIFRNYINDITNMTNIDRKYKEQSNIKSYLSDSSILSIQWERRFKHNVPICFEVPVLQVYTLKFKFSPYNCQSCNIVKPVGNSPYIPNKSGVGNQAMLLDFDKVLNTGLKHINTVKKIDERRKMIANIEPTSRCTDDFVKDVGFRSSINFTIGVRKYPKLKKTKPNCDYVDKTKKLDICNCCGCFRKQTAKRVKNVKKRKRTRSRAYHTNCDVRVECYNERCLPLSKTEPNKTNKDKLNTERKKVNKKENSKIDDKSMICCITEKGMKALNKVYKVKKIPENECKSIKLPFVCCFASKNETNAKRGLKGNTKQNRFRAKDKIYNYKSYVPKVKNIGTKKQSVTQQRKKTEKKFSKLHRCESKCAIKTNSLTNKSVNKKSSPQKPIKVPSLFFLTTEETKKLRESASIIMKFRKKKREFPSSQVIRVNTAYNFDILLYKKGNKLKSKVVAPKKDEDSPSTLSESKATNIKQKRPKSQTLRTVTPKPQPKSLKISYKITKLRKSKLNKGKCNEICFSYQPCQNGASKQQKPRRKAYKTIKSKPQRNNLEDKNTESSVSTTNCSKKSKGKSPKMEANNKCTQDKRKNQYKNCSVYCIPHKCKAVKNQTRINNRLYKSKSDRTTNSSDMFIISKSSTRSSTPKINMKSSKSSAIPKNHSKRIFVKPQSDNSMKSKSSTKSLNTLLPCESNNFQCCKKSKSSQSMCNQKCKTKNKSASVTSKKSSEDLQGNRNFKTKQGKRKKAIQIPPRPQILDGCKPRKCDPHKCNPNKCLSRIIKTSDFTSGKPLEHNKDPERYPRPQKRSNENSSRNSRRSESTKAKIRRYRRNTNRGQPGICITYKCKRQMRFHNSDMNEPQRKKFYIGKSKHQPSQTKRKSSSKAINQKDEKASKSIGVDHSKHTPKTLRKESNKRDSSVGSIDMKKNNVGSESKLGRDDSKHSKKVSTSETNLRKTKIAKSQSSIKSNSVSSGGSSKENLRKHLLEARKKTTKKHKAKSSLSSMPIDMCMLRYCKSEKCNPRKCLHRIINTYDFTSAHENSKGQSPQIRSRKMKSFKHETNFHEGKSPQIRNMKMKTLKHETDFYKERSKQKKSDGIQTEKRRKKSVRSGRRQPKTRTRACHPNICTPYKCDPYRCLKKMEAVNLSPRGSPLNIVSFASVYYFNGFYDESLINRRGNNKTNNYYNIYRRNHSASLTKTKLKHKTTKCNFFIDRSYINSIKETKRKEKSTEYAYLTQICAKRPSKDNRTRIKLRDQRKHNEAVAIIRKLYECEPLFRPYEYDSQRCLEVMKNIMHYTSSKTIRNDLQTSQNKSRHKRKLCKDFVNTDKKIKRHNKKLTSKNKIRTFKRKSLIGKTRKNIARVHQSNYEIKRDNIFNNSAHERLTKTCFMVADQESNFRGNQDVSRSNTIQLIVSNTDAKTKSNVQTSQQTAECDIEQNIFIKIFKTCLFHRKCKTKPTKMYKVVSHSHENFHTIKSKESILRKTNRNSFLRRCFCSISKKIKQNFIKNNASYNFKQKKNLFMYYCHKYCTYKRVGDSEKKSSFGSSQRTIQTYFTETRNVKNPTRKLQFQDETIKRKGHSRTKKSTKPIKTASGKILTDTEIFSNDLQYNETLRVGPGIKFSEPQTIRIGSSVKLNFKLKQYLLSSFIGNKKKWKTEKSKSKRDEDSEIITAHRGEVESSTEIGKKHSSGKTGSTNSINEGSSRKNTTEVETDPTTWNLGSHNMNSRSRPKYVAKKLSKMSRQPPRIKCTSQSSTIHRRKDAVCVRLEKRKTRPKSLTTYRKNDVMKSYRAKTHIKTRPHRNMHCRQENHLIRKNVITGTVPTHNQKIKHTHLNTGCIEKDMNAAYTTPTTTNPQATNNPIRYPEATALPNSNNMYKHDHVTKTFSVQVSSVSQNDIEAILEQNDVTERPPIDIKTKPSENPFIVPYFCPGVCIRKKCNVHKCIKRAHMNYIKQTQGKNKAIPVISIKYKTNAKKTSNNITDIEATRDPEQYSRKNILEQPSTTAKSRNINIDEENQTDVNKTTQKTIQGQTDPEKYSRTSSTSEIYRSKRVLNKIKRREKKSQTETAKTITKTIPSQNDLIKENSIKKLRRHTRQTHISEKSVSKKQNDTMKPQKRSNEGERGEIIKRSISTTNGYSKNKRNKQRTPSHAKNEKISRDDMRKLKRPMHKRVIASKRHSMSSTRSRYSRTKEGGKRKSGKFTLQGQACQKGFCVPKKCNPYSCLREIQKRANDTERNLNNRKEAKKNESQTSTGSYRNGKFSPKNQTAQKKAKSPVLHKNVTKHKTQGTLAKQEVRTSDSQSSTGSYRNAKFSSKHQTTHKEAKTPVPHKKVATRKTKGTLTKQKVKNSKSQSSTESNRNGKYFPKQQTAQEETKSQVLLKNVTKRKKKGTLTKQEVQNSESQSSIGSYRNGKFSPKQQTAQKEVKSPALHKNVTKRKRKGTLSKQDAKNSGSQYSTASDKSSKSLRKETEQKRDKSPVLNKNQMKTAKSGSGVQDLKTKTKRSRSQTTVMPKKQRTTQTEIRKKNKPRRTFVTRKDRSTKRSIKTRRTQVDISKGRIDKENARKIKKKRHIKPKYGECEPGICTPKHCDPYKCLNKMTTRDGNVNSKIKRKTNEGWKNLYTRHPNKDKNLIETFTKNKKIRESKYPLQNDSKGKINEKPLYQTQPKNKQNESLNKGISDLPKKNSIAQTDITKVKKVKRHPNARTRKTQSIIPSKRPIHSKKNRSRKSSDTVQVKKHIIKFKPGLCEPNFCSSAQCDPYECLQKIQQTTTKPTQSKAEIANKTQDKSLKGTSNKDNKIRNITKDPKELESYSNMTEKFVIVKFKPDYCEPGLCVPDQCNPFKCLEASEDKKMHRKRLTKIHSNRSLSDSNNKSTKTKTLTTENKINNDKIQPKRAVSGNISSQSYNKRIAMSSKEPLKGTHTVQTRKRNMLNQDTKMHQPSNKRNRSSETKIKEQKLPKPKTKRSQTEVSKSQTNNIKIRDKKKTYAKHGLFSSWENKRECFLKRCFKFRRTRNKNYLTDTSSHSKEIRVSKFDNKKKNKNSKSSTDLTLLQRKKLSSSTISSNEAKQQKKIRPVEARRQKNAPIDLIKQKQTFSHVQQHLPPSQRKLQKHNSTSTYINVNRIPENLKLGETFRVGSTFRFGVKFSEPHTVRVGSSFRLSFNFNKSPVSSNSTLNRNSDEKGSQYRKTQSTGSMKRKHFKNRVHVPSIKQTLKTRSKINKETSLPQTIDQQSRKKNLHEIGSNTISSYSTQKPKKRNGLSQSVDTIDNRYASKSKMRPKISKKQAESSTQIKTLHKTASSQTKVQQKKTRTQKVQKTIDEESASNLPKLRIKQKMISKRNSLFLNSRSQSKRNFEPKLFKSGIVGSTKTKPHKAVSSQTQVQTKTSRVQNDIDENSGGPQHYSRRTTRKRMGSSQSSDSSQDKVTKLKKRAVNKPIEKSQPKIFKKSQQLPIKTSPISGRSSKLQIELKYKTEIKQNKSGLCDHFKCLREFKERRDLKKNNPYKCETGACKPSPRKCDPYICIKKYLQRNMYVQYGEIIHNQNYVSRNRKDESRAHNDDFSTVRDMKIKQKTKSNSNNRNYWILNSYESEANLSNNNIAIWGIPEVNLPNKRFYECAQIFPASKRNHLSSKYNSESYSEIHSSTEKIRNEMCDDQLRRRTTLNHKHFSTKLNIREKQTLPLVCGVAQLNVSKKASFQTMNALKSVTKQFESCGSNSCRLQKQLTKIENHTKHDLVSTQLCRQSNSKIKRAKYVKRSMKNAEHSLFEVHRHNNVPIMCLTIRIDNVSQGQKYQRRNRYQTNKLLYVINRKKKYRNKIIKANTKLSKMINNYTMFSFSSIKYHDFKTSDLKQMQIDQPKITNTIWIYPFFQCFKVIQDTNIMTYPKMIRSKQQLEFLYCQPSCMPEKCNPYECLKRIRKKDQGTESTIRSYETSSQTKLRKYKEIQIQQDVMRRIRKKDKLTENKIRSFESPSQTEIKKSKGKQTQKDFKHVKRKLQESTKIINPHYECEPNCKPNKCDAYKCLKQISNKNESKLKNRFKSRDSNISLSNESVRLQEQINHTRPHSEKPSQTKIKYNQIKDTRQISKGKVLRADNYRTKPRLTKSTTETSTSENISILSFGPCEPKCTPEKCNPYKCLEKIKVKNDKPREKHFHRTDSHSQTKMKIPKQKKTQKTVSVRDRKTTYIKDTSPKPYYECDRKICKSGQCDPYKCLQQMNKTNTYNIKGSMDSTKSGSASSSHTTINKETMTIRTTPDINILKDRKRKHVQTKKHKSLRKTKRKKFQPKIKKVRTSVYECEPNICIPEKCNPYECLQRIRKRYKLKESSLQRSKVASQTEVIESKEKSSQDIIKVHDQQINYPKTNKDLKTDERHYERKTYQNTIQPKTNKPWGINIDACDPKVCTIDKCNPYKCLERIRFKEGKIRRTKTASQTKIEKSKTKRIQESVKVHDRKITYPKETRKTKRPFYECDNVCIPKACDPYKCLERINKNNVYNFSQLNEFNTSDISSKSTKSVSTKTKKIVAVQPVSLHKKVQKNDKHKRVTKTNKNQYKVRSKSNKMWDIYECEPDSCVPETCNPYECLARIRKTNRLRESKPLRTKRASQTKLKTSKEKNVQKIVKVHDRQTNLDKRLIVKSETKVSRPKPTKKIIKSTEPQKQVTGNKTSTKPVHKTTQEYVKEKKIILSHYSFMECEPKSCVTNECNPYKCLERIRDSNELKQQIIKKSEIPRKTKVPEPENEKNKIEIRSINKAKESKIMPYECQQNFCKPGKCDSFECLKQLSELQLNVLSTGTAMNDLSNEKRNEKSRVLKSYESEPKVSVSKQTEIKNEKARSEPKVKNDIATTLQKTMNNRKNSKKISKFGYSECEPFSCIPEKCNPYECLQRIRKKDYHIESKILRSKTSTQTEIKASKIKTSQQTIKVQDRQTSQPEKNRSSYYQSDQNVCEPKNCNPHECVRRIDSRHFHKLLPVYKSIRKNNRIESAESYRREAQYVTKTNQKKRIGKKEIKKYNYTEAKPLKEQINLYQCESNFCMADKCDPYVCLEKIKKRRVHQLQYSNKHSQKAFKKSESSKNSKVDEESRRKEKPRTYGTRISKHVEVDDIIPRKINKPKHKNKNYYECGRKLCIEEKCDPYECLKRISKRHKPIKAKNKILETTNLPKTKTKTTQKIVNMSDSKTIQLKNESNIAKPYYECDRKFCKPWKHVKKYKNNNFQPEYYTHAKCNPYKCLERISTRDKFTESKIRRYEVPNQTKTKKLKSKKTQKVLKVHYVKTSQRKQANNNPKLYYESEQNCYVSEKRHPLQSKAIKLHDSSTSILCKTKSSSDGSSVVKDFSQYEYDGSRGGSETIEETQPVLTVAKLSKKRPETCTPTEYCMKKEKLSNNEVRKHKMNDKQELMKDCNPYDCFNRLEEKKINTSNKIRHTPMEYCPKTNDRNSIKQDSVEECFKRMKKRNTRKLNSLSTNSQSTNGNSIELQCEPYQLHDVVKTKAKKITNKSCNEYTHEKPNTTTECKIVSKTPQTSCCKPGQTKLKCPGILYEIEVHKSVTEIEIDYSVSENPKSMNSSKKKRREINNYSPSSNDRNICYNVSDFSTATCKRILKRYCDKDKIYTSDQRDPCQLSKRKKRNKYPCQSSNNYNNYCNNKRNVSNTGGKGKGKLKQTYCEQNEPCQYLGIRGVHNCKLQTNKCLKGCSYKPLKKSKFEHFDRKTDVKNHGKLTENNAYIQNYFVPEYDPFEYLKVVQKKYEQTSSDNKSEFCQNSNVNKIKKQIMRTKKNENKSNFYALDQYDFFKSTETIRDNGNDYKKIKNNRVNIPPVNNIKTNYIMLKLHRDSNAFISRKAKKNTSSFTSKFINPQHSKISIAKYCKESVLSLHKRIFCRNCFQKIENKLISKYKINHKISLDKKGNNHLCVKSKLHARPPECKDHCGSVDVIKNKLEKNKPHYGKPNFSSFESKQCKLLTRNKYDTKKSFSNRQKFIDHKKKNFLNRTEDTSENSFESQINCNDRKEQKKIFNYISPKEKTVELKNNILHKKAQRQFENNNIVAFCTIQNYISNTQKNTQKKSKYLNSNKHKKNKERRVDNETLGGIAIFHQFKKLFTIASKFLRKIFIKYNSKTDPCRQCSKNSHCNKNKINPRLRRKSYRLRKCKSTTSLTETHTRKLRSENIHKRQNRNRKLTVIMPYSHHKKNEKVIFSHF